MTSESFYTTVSAISFTLLGLWWVVVQAHESWRLELARRRMAYAVSLHFLLPGTMSILSLVAPDVGWLWRVTFATAGLIGIIGTVYVVRTLRVENDCPRLAQAIEWVAIPVYAIVTIVAAAPELASNLGLGLSALQVEGIILAILLFFGVNAAWILMIEPPRATPA
ncbi:MAG: hypothetical protein ABIQ58_05645 [Candidatus Limnocylindrales bacterium]